MLNLALPKGSLEKQTLSIFKAADLDVKATSRGYNPHIDDPRIANVKILRPQEIPKYVEEGYFDLGISGHDWVQESGADVIEVANLPYSKQGEGIVKIVVAVPIESGINDVKEIRPNSRVSTEFPNLTKEYFQNLGIPVRVFYSYGATEAKVPELMDIIVDLTETGETLRRNGLKIIGTILESSTSLIANKKSWKDPEKRKSIEELRILLLGVIAARGKVLLSMNVPKEKLDDVVGVLPAMKNPTISQLYGSTYYAVETVVDKKDVNILLPQLKDGGAEDIIEINITKIVE